MEAAESALTRLVVAAQANLGEFAVEYSGGSGWLLGVWVVWTSSFEQCLGRWSKMIEEADAECKGFVSRFSNVRGSWRDFKHVKLLRAQVPKCEGFRLELWRWKKHRLPKPVCAGSKTQVYIASLASAKNQCVTRVTQ